MANCFHTKFHESPVPKFVCSVINTANTASKKLNPNPDPTHAHPNFCNRLGAGDASQTSHPSLRAASKKKTRI